jgi:hypothetical protein
MADSHNRSFSTQSPEWIKGIKNELDYGWRLYGNSVQILPDATIPITGFNAELFPVWYLQWCLPRCTGDSASERYVST